MLSNITTSVIDALNISLTETKSTRNIQKVSWPSELPFFVYMSDTVNITSKEITDSI